MKNKSVRRFNVTVVSPSGATTGEENTESLSPVSRHRAQQPFASIPEDQALDGSDPKSNVLQQRRTLSNSKRCSSPAPSWDFNLNDGSDSVIC